MGTNYFAVLMCSSYEHCLTVVACKHNMSHVLPHIDFLMFLIIISNYQDLFSTNYLVRNIKFYQLLILQL